MRGGAAWERLQVKANMVLFASNTVWSISERVRSVREDTLYIAFTSAIADQFLAKNLHQLFCIS